MPIDANKLRNMVEMREAERSQNVQEEWRLRRERELREWCAKIENIRLNLDNILETTAREGKRQKRIVDFPTWLCPGRHPKERMFRRGCDPKYFSDDIQRLYDECNRRNLNPVIIYVNAQFDESDRYFLDVSW